MNKDIINKKVIHFGHNFQYDGYRSTQDLNTALTFTPDTMILKEALVNIQYLEGDNIIPERKFDSASLDVFSTLSNDDKTLTKSLSTTRGGATGRLQFDEKKPLVIELYIDALTSANLCFGIIDVAYITTGDPIAKNCLFYQSDGLIRKKGKADAVVSSYGQGDRLRFEMDGTGKIQFYKYDVNGIPVEQSYNRNISAGQYKIFAVDGDLTNSSFISTISTPNSTIGEQKDSTTFLSSDAIIKDNIYLYPSTPTDCSGVLYNFHICGDTNAKQVNINNEYELNEDFKKYKIIKLLFQQFKTTSTGYEPILDILQKGSIYYTVEFIEYSKII